ncbi:MAG: peptidoglycan DD-metalloendopeptidase family protein [Bacteroidaceae bacterium]|nr:peptidoglycan DD-metalloendopeptidase family protein [Bacteroidaceae bacterium]
MRHIQYILFALFFSFSLASAAQTAEIKKMRNQVGSLQKEIAQKENILLSSKKDINSKLQNLDLLTAQIKERKELINMLVSEVDALNEEIDKLNKEVAENEKRVGKSKDEYASALKRTRRYGSFQSKLLFVISADDFNSMARRYRYTRQYMQAHKRKGEELKENIAALQLKKSELDSVLATKKLSLDEQTHQRKALQLLEEKQRSLLSELKKESRKVEKELLARRKQLQKLNADIERAIDREIAAQKAREAAARKAAAKAAAGKKKGGKGSKAEPAKPVVAEDAGVKEMSGSFAQNKGKLPVPITGPFHIVSNFGPQKGVVGKGNVKIDYGGITLGGERGAKARCVFDGRVTSVIRQGDFAFVLVRHGKYITVYCRLGEITVQEGDKVSAGDIIGTVATDASGHTRLLFQLRNEKTKLNPMQWLKIR